MKSEKFHELISLRRAVRIRPKYATDQTIHGFPVALSEHFVLLHEIHEFHLDGYAAVPLRQIYAVRSGEAERAIERIFQGEKLDDKIGPPPYPLNLDSFQSLFRSLQQQNKSVTIDMLDVAGDMMEEGFVLGSIVGMTARSVAILNIDDTGHRDTEPTVIAYKQIKWVTFDSEYVNIFAKYVK